MANEAYDWVMTNADWAFYRVSVEELDWTIKAFGKKRQVEEATNVAWVKVVHRNWEGVLVRAEEAKTVQKANVARVVVVACRAENAEVEDDGGDDGEEEEDLHSYPVVAKDELHVVVSLAEARKVAVLEQNVPGLASLG